MPRHICPDGQQCENYSDHIMAGPDMDGCCNGCARYAIHTVMAEQMKSQELYAQPTMGTIVVKMETGEIDQLLGIERIRENASRDEDMPELDSETHRTLYRRWRWDLLKYAVK
jgi:hypothetical protein